MPPVLEQTQNQPIAPLPRTRERGHLTLVDWEGVAPTAPAPVRPAVKPSSLRRTWVDRAYDRAFLVLLAVTALGVAASLVQH